jgi:hypothetical protein
MHRRSDANAMAGLEVRALYSIGALAHAVGVTRHLMLRLLRKNKVDFVTVGRSVLVPLSEIETRIPTLWRGILAAEAVRAEAREVGRRAG